LLLSDKYTFLTEYFTDIINSKRHSLPQSILFYGNDFEAQYTLATEIARLANCSGDKSDNCNCINCSWIRENSHPSVMTISKIDNKPEDDDSKTVISVRQSAMIKELLMTDSEFHRFFIFCDRDDDGNISGLNNTNFKADTANSLLKIIEEPQSEITFIFLTRYIDDLLPTIVSRSQCFFVPALGEVKYDYSSIAGQFENYWDFDRKDVFDISQKLQDIAKDKGLNKVLDDIQNYIFITLKNNPKNTVLIKHIEILEKSKRQAALGIKAAGIFDELCLDLIN